MRQTSLIKTIKKKKMSYLNLIGSFLIGSSIMMINQPDLPKEPFIEATDWVLIENDKILTIHERWLMLPDGNKTRERKATFQVDANIGDIVNTISNADGIAYWMSGVEETAELEVVDSASKIVYIHFGVPWPFRDRDLITRITTVSDCDSSSILVFMSAVLNYIPEKRKITRLKSYEASWKITMLKNGIAEIEFCAYSATPPVAPLWIQDPITLRLFKDNLLNLKYLLTDNCI